MPLDNRATDVQPQAEADAGTILLFDAWYTMKSLEEAFLLRGGETGSAVADLHPRAPVRDVQAHHDWIPS